ncbi:GPI ethanolamine phosphate transferase 2 [Triplophysa tibetana]|uniref:GPI ethanolamine phosphate transferase 2 n=1 Tax=Triplophysa tibetana TaxID=1572043 RepID=A0A5A9NK52_9TELE|nr:GPI ethanolamine phosphate transferase 2 [Triplophysa tibetana]
MFIMRLSSSVFALLCLMCEVLCIALFLRGFFPVPVKSSVSSKSKVSDLPPEPLTGSGTNASESPGPVFRRVVILLVDALREDFVFGSDGLRFMPYTRQVVERGSSHSFIAKARAPTVTMPRIKALTTGSIPGFIDVVMNLNSPALLEDNLIWQAKNAGKRIIFYGDDTWVRLFPKHFMEQDGTTSFFVSDYTEVDNNVTRHLDDTLKRDDWDILILHYLGLDHIGHISGPHSSLIGPKLTEMDDIVKKIHAALISKESEGTLPNLLVLCGDHGMTETGSHGGSSDPEINTPLVLISPAFRRKGGFEVPGVLEQVDLAPTLALGQGLPISKNSVGRLIPAVFEDLSLRDRLRFLQLNGHQLSCLLEDNNPSFHKEDGYELFRVAEKSHGSWMKLYMDGNTSEVLGNMGKKVLKQYLEALKAMSSALSKQLGKYDMYSMIMGMILVLILLLLAMPEALSREAAVDIPLAASLFSLPFYLLCLLGSALHVLICTSAGGLCYLCSLPWVLVFTLIILSSALMCALVTMAARRMPTSTKTPTKGSGWTLSELDVVLLVGTVGHTLSLSSSSFIEEEHQTWFFLLNTLCLAVFQDVCRKYFREQEEGGEEESFSSFSPAVELGMSAGSEKWLALATPLLTLTCCRLLRSLNHTGVQWAHLPDFGHWLNSADHKMFLSLLAALSLALIFLLIQRHCSLVSKIALSLGLLGVYSYRAAVGNVLFPWQHSSRAVSKLEVERWDGEFLTGERREESAMTRPRRADAAFSGSQRRLNLLFAEASAEVTEKNYRCLEGVSFCQSGGTVEARFVYVFVLGILFTGVKDLLRAQLTSSGGDGGRLKSRGLWEVYSGVVLLVALLFRAHNLPTLACCLLIQTVMAQFIWKRLHYDAAQTTIMHYWFGQAFFYFQGNSNNIGTVDISVGFVGLESYVEAPAVILTALSTYAGPLLWAFHLLCYLTSQRHRAVMGLGHGSYCFALLRSIPAVFYVVLVTGLRYHLFIWSVFSPKLLYEAMHTLITTAVCLCFTFMDQDRSGRL